jgi:hypothetical protein
MLVLRLLSLALFFLVATRAYSVALFEKQSGKRPGFTSTKNDPDFCLPLSGDSCLRNLMYGKYLLSSDVPCPAHPSQ